MACFEGTENDGKFLQNTRKRSDCKETFLRKFSGFILDQFVYCLYYVHSNFLLL